MAILLQLTINALITGAVYALIASGLTFIYATTRVFHLAHGAVIALAAYGFWWLSAVALWPLPLAACGGCAVACAAGLLMNELVYEPLRARGSKGLVYLVATIALLMMGNALILMLFGAETHSLNIETRSFHVFGATVTLLQVVIMIISAALLIGLAALSRGTRFGKAMRAVADQETMAEVLGINTRDIRRLTFLIGSFLAGVAGVFIALEFNLEPNMGVMFAIKGFAASVIGGPGSMSGALVGSLFLSGVEQGAVWFWGSGWRNAAAFTLLFLFLLLRPTGFFGRKRFA